MWSEQLGLFLGIHKGLLRYFTAEGKLVLTPKETAEQEIKRAEQENREAEIQDKIAEQEARKAERLAAKLRELNIDPDTI